MQEVEETKDADAATNQDEDEIDDSFNEHKLQDFSGIPQLKDNQNAGQLNRQSMPFSHRLFNGSIKIDHRDVHAVAN